LGIDQTETNLLGFIHPLDQNVYESFVFNINKLKENETINTEVRLLVNSENYKWYELTAVIFQKNVNNKLKRYLAVLRDINSKKENEIIINDFYERISFELEKASETQMTLITKKFPKIQNINFNLFFSPMEKIGGDFINYNYSEKDKIGIIFGDVTGHGISASMVSSMVILAYKLLEKRNYPPSELLFNINEYLKPLIVDHFVCCIFFEIDFQKKRLTFTNAGGPNLIIIRENKIIELPKMGLPLLIDENLDLKEYQEEIKPNDILLVFSDGLYEIFNEKNEILGYENFKKLILQSYKQKGKNFLTFLIDQCLKFNKQKIKDDMTLLCIDFGENF
ncbi:MAG: serine/threonine-protein phosphatase, partial [Leptospiraceae bacterium]|nr:serine/threonine-protein phosphatase [Leptospiraceae bacterium]